MVLSSCRTEAEGGGPGEPLHYLGQSRFQGFAVQPGGRDRFPGDFILPGPQLPRIAHVSLDCVPDVLRLRLGFLDEGLQLAQLLDLALDFVDTHCVTSFNFRRFRWRGRAGLRLERSVDRVSALTLTPLGVLTCSMLT